MFFILVVKEDVMLKSLPEMLIWIVIIAFARIYGFMNKNLFSKTRALNKPADTFCETADTTTTDKDALRALEMIHEYEKEEEKLLKGPGSSWLRLSREQYPDAHDV
ncbi:MAG: hypothetical protein ACD_56C00057G0004 [uncultured bacterium]|nr:MAG: hypothetical protein ACD_56C00057G0004 [uncultured bacterium]